MHTFLWWTRSRRSETSPRGLKKSLQYYKLFSSVAVTVRDLNVQIIMKKIFRLHSFNVCQLFVGIWTILYFIMFIWQYIPKCQILTTVVTVLLLIWQHNFLPSSSLSHPIHVLLTAYGQVTDTPVLYFLKKMQSDLLFYGQIAAHIAFGEGNEFDLDLSLQGVSYTDSPRSLQMWSILVVQ